MPIIRLATFNVFYGTDPEKIAKAIKANQNLKNADVIFLQEIEAHSDEAKERAGAIADELGLGWVYAPARESGKETKLHGTHGLAILSKFPIKEFEVIPLRKYNLGYNSRKRIALNAIIDVNGVLIQVSNVHLDLRINIKDRILQISEVVEKIDSHHIKKVVIGGDFNTVPLLWMLRLFPIFYSSQRKKFNNFLLDKGFSTKFTKIGYTMQQKIIRFSLDSIYTKELTIKDFGIERDLKVSDHKPVWVDIEL
jgi:endonuclease/exonuclease/phosphatase family metal-dependent hydrolase